MSVPNSTGLFVGLLLVSFYTGYFGAGAGILVFNPAWRRRAYPIIFP